MNIALLDHQDPQFPDPALALEEPNGLLAVGGNLAPDTLIAAYRLGIFPWFSDDDPLLWWSPDPRAVIYPDKLHVSKSLAKLHRQQRYRVTCNRAFEQVVESCSSSPRRDEGGTWITSEMVEAYYQLHQHGHAHSIEIWRGDMLVGGLYGVSVGSIFCGESMFSRASNASKLALMGLLEIMPGLTLIDCQLPNPHLHSLGAIDITRDDFLALLQNNRDTHLQWPKGAI